MKTLQFQQMQEVQEAQVVQVHSSTAMYMVAKNVVATTFVESVKM